MKWTKETQVYMWAKYYSDNGKWVAYDTEKTIKHGSNKKIYNVKTKQFERMDKIKHYWILENLETGETIDIEFKTLKAAKEYAENN